MTPAYSVASWLATHLGMTLGTDIFEGPPVDDNGLTSDPSVFVQNTGGQSVEEALGRGSAILWPTVQLTTRSAKRTTAQSKARAAAYIVLDQAAPTGYVSCDLLDSDPLLVEVDDKGRYYFSTNLRLTARR